MRSLPLTQPLHPSNQNKTPQRKLGSKQKNNRQIMQQAKTFKYKNSNKFCQPIRIIGAAEVLAISEVTDFQALLASLSCIVRDLRSTKSSTSSGSDISKAIATRSKVSRVGVDFPLNHLDQCLMFTSVTSCKSLYESSKNLSAFVCFKAYINAILSLVVDFCVNKIVAYKDNDSINKKHPVGRTLLVNSIPRCRGADCFIHLLALFRGWFHYEYNTFVGTSVPTNWNAMPSYADMGRVV